MLLEEENKEEMEKEREEEKEKKAKQKNKNKEKNNCALRLKIHEGACESAWTGVRQAKCESVKEGVKDRCARRQVRHNPTNYSININYLIGRCDNERPSLRLLGAICHLHVELDRQEGRPRWTLMQTGKQVGLLLIRVAQVRIIERRGVCIINNEAARAGRRQGYSRLTLVTAEVRLGTC